MAAAQFGLLVSRDGFNGVSTHYSSGVPTMPQRNNLINYSGLRDPPVNDR